MKARVRLHRFQWVNLQIRYLNGMKLEEDILENLGKLPKTLEATYSQIMEDMMSDGTSREWEITRKALMWIMCSRELLTKEQWAEFSYWPKEFPKDSHHIDTLFELCRNLVTWDSQLKVVRFAHLSVHEYLETKFSSVDTNSMAAESCLLLFDPTNWPGVAKLTLLPARPSLINYSTLNWADHIESSYSCEQHMSRVVLDRLKLFLGTPSEPGQAYCNWLHGIFWQALGLQHFPGGPLLQGRLYDILAHLESTPPNPFFAASYFTFGEELREQWECGSFDLNCKNKRGETLLFVASMRGNGWVVNMLLGKGACVNTGSSAYGSNPLMAAIRHGHWRAAVQLLNNGANTSATEGDTTVMRSATNRDLSTEIIGAVMAATAGNPWRTKQLMGLLQAGDFSIGVGLPRR